MPGVLAFVMGASVGSFLNVVGDRLPAMQSLVRPRSFCPVCKTTLAPVDLMPLVSYLWLRGRCRTCGARIPFRLFVVELTTALLFTAVSLRVGLGPDFIVLSAVVALLLVVAVIDVETGLVPDRILLPAAGAALMLALLWPALGQPRTLFGNDGVPASFLNSVLAGYGAFLLFLSVVLVYPRGMGTGDVKLAGLLGLLVGFPAILFALWLAIVSGGVAALLLLLRGRDRKQPLPFAPFLAVGGIVGLLGGADVISWYWDLALRGGALWS